jgi:hypothetical protein
VALSASSLAGCATYAPREAYHDAYDAEALRGEAPAYWLPPVYRQQAVLGFAWAQVGKRYCWGGTGPACFDCSGLVQRAYAAAGIRVPRTADAIATEVPEIRLNEVQAGDILWWPGHVGLYAGNGWVVEALDHRHGVVGRPAKRPDRAFRPSG